MRTVRDVVQSPYKASCDTPLEGTALRRPGPYSFELDGKSPAERAGDPVPQIEQCGERLPPSIRAITACVVPARTASCACVRPTTVRARLTITPLVAHLPLFRSPSALGELTESTGSSDTARATNDEANDIAFRQAWRATAPARSPSRIESAIPWNTQRPYRPTGVMSCARRASMASDLHVDAGHAHV